MPFTNRAMLARCLVGIEACASSHHWSRELQALGHTVRLMPPAYVKPYVKRQKNDATDAEAICEAVAIADMRFVPTKTPEQQSFNLVVLAEGWAFPWPPLPARRPGKPLGSLRARRMGGLPRGGKRGPGGGREPGVEWP